MKAIGAQLLVCEHGCCCGRVDKGYPPVPRTRLARQWSARGLRPLVHLTWTACLGPCDELNVALLVTPSGSAWLGGLTDPSEFDLLLDWAAECGAAGRLVPPPLALVPNVRLRFRGGPAAVAVPSDETSIANDREPATGSEP